MINIVLSWYYVPGFYRIHVYKTYYSLTEWTLVERQNRLLTYELESEKIQ